MKIMLLAVYLIAMGTFTASAQERVFQKPTGPYLGQKPPGLKPVLFAPGFISKEQRELNSVFTHDGKEFYFSIVLPGKGYRMFFTKETDSGWTKPELVPFSSENSDVDMCMAPDGKRMYFGSTRPIHGVEQKDFKIWYVDRINDGWSEAKILEGPVNQGRKALYPSISRNGTMFFQANRDGGMGASDIYYSKLEDGKYGKVVNAGPAINSRFPEGDVLIAPDESYMIVCGMERLDAIGGGDLYISFKKADGTWGKTKNMGRAINSSSNDYCPVLSPDGKYFFFSSNRGGTDDIYWVDAGVINKLKSSE